MAPLGKLSTLFPAFLDSDEEIEEFKVSTTVGERIKHIVGKGKRFADSKIPIFPYLAALLIQSTRVVEHRTGMGPTPLTLLHGCRNLQSR